MQTIKRDARLAGGLYLLAGGLGAFAELFVRGQVYVPGRPFETSQIIMNADFIVRAGIFAELGMAVLYLFLAFSLYNLLKHVSKATAVSMVGLVACCVPVVFVATTSQYAALHILTDADYLSVFTESQLQALSFLMLNIQGIGYLTAQVFFGLWLLPLGILVFRSGFLPRAFGILLISACVAYMVEFILVLFELKSFYMLFDWTMPVYATAELGFIFWLLAFGVDEEKWSMSQATNPITVAG